MGKGKVASLVGLGLLLGFFAFQVQQDSKEASDLIAGNQKWLYDNCLKLNATIKEIPSDIRPAEQRDCMAEYVDSNDE